MIENLELIELLKQLNPEEAVMLTCVLVVCFGSVIVSVLSYFIANIGNAFLFSIAPALWLVVKKIKDSNKHGDSTSEFQHLQGSKMKMLYKSDTIFYFKYMNECEKMGIGPGFGKKE